MRADLLAETLAKAVGVFLNRAIHSPEFVRAFASAYVRAQNADEDGSDYTEYDLMCSLMRDTFRKVCADNRVDFSAELPEAVIVAAIRIVDGIDTIGGDK